MKTLTGKIVFMCAIAITCVSAFAQGPITISLSDVQTQFAPNNILINRTDSVTTSVNIGSPGATSWDFSALKTSSKIELKSVPVTGTPYAAQFTSATHVFQTTLSVSYAGLSLTGTAYQYLVVGPNVVGLGNGAAAPFGTLGNVVLSTTDVPGDELYALPSTLGTTWTSTPVETQVVTFGGSELSRTVKNRVIAYAVDAYGPMKIPLGGTYDALRIKKTETTSGKIIGYIFLSKSGASVQVTASDTLQPDNGTIQVSSVGWSGPIATTDVRPETRVPAEYSLRQNFPNPFNPSTTITYDVAHTGLVVLNVYNLLGQQVATLVNGTKEPGSYKVSWNGDGLPSGIYFYKMQSGSFTATKRMLLLK